MPGHWDQLTRGQLRLELDKRGQDTQGTRSALIERLESCPRDECPQVKSPPDTPRTEVHNFGTSREYSQDFPDNICPDGGQDDSDNNSYLSAATSVTTTKAKLAGLQVRAEYLKQKHKLDRQAQEIQAMQESLALEMQIREVAASEAALHKEKSTEQMSEFNFCQRQSIKAPVSGDSYSEPEHAPQQCSSGLHLRTDVNQSYELARRLHLPTLEMSTFDGDIGKYRCFMRAFQANIVARVSSEEEKLHYLYQYTGGRPKQIVSTCLHLPPERGFAEAMVLLDRKYGSPVQVAAGLVDQLLQHSSIRADDIESLETFAIHLRGTMNALASLPNGAGSVDVKTIRLLLEKLPLFMRDKWRVKVDDIEQAGNRPAEFDDFVHFIEREARIASNPSYGRHLTTHSAPKQYPGERKVEPGHNARGKLLAGNLTASNLSSSCLKCGRNHDIEQCPEFEAMDKTEKINFIHSNRLCFACLQRNHISKNCRERKVCSKCQGSHPTVLHFERQEPSRLPAAVTSGHLASRGGAKLQVVPVQVTLSGVTKSTSAFLDSGSTHSFISRRLLNMLGATPTKTTSVTLSTINADQQFDTCIVPQVTIEDLDCNNRLELPPLFVLNRIPVTHDDAPNASDLSKWPYLLDEGVKIEESLEGEVGLLIGNNVAAATEPIQIVPSQNGGPFAVRTRYGWILGGAEKMNETRLKAHRLQLHTENELHDNRAEYKKGLSADDIQWYSIVSSSCRFVDGHYEIALPFRSASPSLPNNRLVAMKRLEHLKRKFHNNDEFAKKYTQQIDTLLEKGYAEIAPVRLHDSGQGVWYLPHHAVEHPTKGDKLRVVFDCACQFEGSSLNGELLQGPDFTNSLTDVLLRFRQEPVAFIADIEGMFLQVKVPESQRDYLRFLWWPDGDITRNPMEYRMSVHLFGATSSPSCANFALRRTASDNAGLFDADVSQTVFDRFYVDDCLATRNSEDGAIKLADNLKQLCLLGGFNLTKFVSNSGTVLKSIPEADRSTKVQTVTPGLDVLPTDRALGVSWDVRLDTLGYQVDKENFVNKSRTRRGMLSATAALYDPLGLAAPYVMQARMILQELTRLRLGWDEAIPKENGKLWEQWIADLRCLPEYKLPRCLCPGGLSTAATLELHHFSDASERAYGTVSYIRSVSQDGQVSCNILLSKSHLAPLKPLSIPRLELSAATLAVRVNLELERALQLACKARTFFWTDSTTVLKYIKNRTARFHVFVANRLAVIRDGSSFEQWRWVPSEQNPADILSRGCNVGTLQDSKWKHGPQFLRSSHDSWPQTPELAGSHADLEVKEVKVNEISLKSCSEAYQNPVQKLADHYSTWLRLKRSVAWICRVTARLAHRDALNSSPELTLRDLESAERKILKEVQLVHYEKEITDLMAGRQVQQSSSIVSLDPVLEDDLLRVGGRLRHATDLEYESRHPIILPHADNVTKLIILHTHEKVGHEGRQYVLAELRRTFWVIKGNAAVRRYLQQCISCRRRLRPPETQKMADLPADRVQQGDHPWASTGVDLFGPFYTKQGRSQVKRYGVIFTCLTIRAVHLEVAHSLSTDSFICALRRFIARRGSHVRVIRSDNGTNFVGADRELKKELDALATDQSRIDREAMKHGIEWRWNPPGGSHFGGIWERLIRSVRKILGALLREQTFSDETLCTFLCEAESIINNRPLVPVTSDPRDQAPLTPNHFLHMNSIVMPSAVSMDSDTFSRRSWRRAAYLAGQFWRRWRTEYLPLLQTRPGDLARSKTNVQTGDVVLVVDNAVPRGVWPLGLVEEVKMSSDAQVRSVKIRCKGATFWRPITKLVKITGDSDAE